MEQTGGDLPPTLYAAQTTTTTTLADTTTTYGETATHPQTLTKTRMWVNAQRDGCPAKYRWRPLFNAAKFG